MKIIYYSYPVQANLVISVNKYYKISETFMTELYGYILNKTLEKDNEKILNKT